MIHLAALPVQRTLLTLASIRSQTPLPGPDPMLPLPSEVEPPPPEIPPQIPPEIREPDQPGENMPINNNPSLLTPTRH